MNKNERKKLLREYSDNKTDINHSAEFQAQNFFPFYTKRTARKKNFAFCFLLNRIVVMHANNDKHIHLSSCTFSIMKYTIDIGFVLLPLLLVLFLCHFI